MKPSDETTTRSRTERWSEKIQQYETSKHQIEPKREDGGVSHFKVQTGRRGDRTNPKLNICLKDEKVQKMKKKGKGSPLLK